MSLAMFLAQILLHGQFGNMPSHKTSPFLKTNAYKEINKLNYHQKKRTQSKNPCGKVFSMSVRREKLNVFNLVVM